MPLDFNIDQPVRQDFTIYRGDSFEWPIIIREQFNGPPIDLTGLLIRAQIRNRPNGKLLGEFSVVVGSSPTFDPAEGKITLMLTTTQTAALQGGVWDLELYGSETNTHTIVVGMVTFVQDVTRWT